MQWPLVVAFIPIVNILWCGASAQDCNYTSFLLNLGYSKDCIDSSRSSLISCSNGEDPPHKECCPPPENITHILTEVKTLLQESAEENSSSVVNSLLQEMKSERENSGSEIKAIRQEIKSEGENTSSVVKSLLQEIKSQGENSSSVVEALLQEMKLERENSVSEIKAIRQKIKSEGENTSSVVKSLLQEIKSQGENSSSVVEALLQEMKLEKENSVSEMKAIRQEMKSAEKNSSSVVNSLLQEMKSERENSVSEMKAIRQEMKSAEKNSSSVVNSLLQEMKSERENSVSEIKAIRQEIKSEGKNSLSVMKSLLQEIKSEIGNSVSEMKAIRQEMKTLLREIKSQGENSSTAVVNSLLQEMKTEWKAITVESAKQNSAKTNSKKNCADLRVLLGDEFSAGVQTVYPYFPNPQPVVVYCDQVTDGGGWTVIQSRSPLPVRENFKRNWGEYVKGFGDPKGEFWLGLDNIHALTNSGKMELRIDLEDAEGQRRWAHYATFHVGDEASKYVLRIGGFSGDAGDGMTYPSDGMKFSTFDSDNDLYSENCGELYNGGWWFNACSLARLNGMPIVGEDPNREGIHWYPFRGWYHSVKKATMKLRPVSYL